MDPIRSPGISSGLDVNAIVAQLVAAERAPAAQRIQRQDTKLATQISALGALKGALGNLQSSVNPLKTESAFQTRTVASSSESIVSGTATASAASGSFAVEVLQLASAQKIITGAIAGGAGAVIGTGTLTVSMGANAFDVVIDDSNNSVTGIRDAINGAANNTGVRATIINTADGARLVLTARDTGAANAIRVTQAGGNGGLATLVYDPPTTTSNYTELEPAQDAQIRVEGFDITSATNTITGAVDGDDRAHSKVRYGFQCGRQYACGAASLQSYDS
jgi:flagellar hook-associated protein 2